MCSTSVWSCSKSWSSHLWRRIWLYKVNGRLMIAIKLYLRRNLLHKGTVAWGKYEMHCLKTPTQSHSYTIRKNGQFHTKSPLTPPNVCPEVEKLTPLPF